MSVCSLYVTDIIIKKTGELIYPFLTEQTPLNLHRKFNHQTVKKELCACAEMYSFHQFHSCYFKFEEVELSSIIILGDQSSDASI